MEDGYKKLCETFIQLSKLVMARKIEDSVRYLQRMAFASRKSDLMVWMDLNRLVGASLECSDERTYESVTRGLELQPAPRDDETKLDLLTKNEIPIHLETDPVYDRAVQASLETLVGEYGRREDIVNAGLEVSNKIIFYGPPGVGKTLAAKWLANKLKLPLYTLNLAAVMSSLLGKTGNNIRRVFEFVSKERCILLLDEFDAIAKNRNDDTDVGELKRLVTVLLQEIDCFPQGNVLIAATNHSELLDPAVWRRFDVAIDFSKPSNESITVAVKKYLGADADNGAAFVDVLSVALRGLSYSDIKRCLTQIRKEALVNGETFGDCVKRWLAGRRKALGREGRRLWADALIADGCSQREASATTGVSRDTIRKYHKKG